MALKQELMASSLPAAAASKLGYDTPATAVAQAGSSLATATLLTSNFSIVTSGTGGVQITELKSPTVVINNSGASCNVYPPASPSSCAINALSAGAAFAVANGKQAIFIPAGPNFVGLLSA